MSEIAAVQPTKPVNPYKTHKAAAALVRVQSLRGDAIEYDCVVCDDEADHWSYSGEDSNERTCPKTGQAYSVNPAFYIPLCARCHWGYVANPREAK